MAKAGRERRRAAEELQVLEEIEFHIEQRTESLIRSGLSPEQARLEAERRFGGRESIARECLALADRRRRRRARSEALFEMGRDLRQVARGLRRRPGFTAAAVLILALGIGANAAMFSLIDAVVLRSLPHRDPERLVAVAGGSLAELTGLTQRARCFESVAAFDGGLDLTYTGKGEPARLKGATVSVNLFGMLGASPQRGSHFQEEDARPGGTPKVILSDRLWRDRFGGREEVLGSSVALDGRLYAVTAIMPAEFRFPNEATQLWLPLVIDDSNQGAYWGSYFLSIVARLAPGFDQASATTELRRVFEELRLENPIWTPLESYSLNAGLQGLQADMGGNLRPLLSLLQGAVFTVLLIVCVNLANLLLARSGARRRETAIRACLGASRTRLISFLLKECLVLAAVGAGLGLLLAQFLTDSLAGRIPGLDGRYGSIGVDLRVVAFSAAMALATAAAFGLLPALRLSRTGAIAVLRESGRSGALAAGRRTRDVLVVAQVALSVVLVVCSGMMLTTLWKLSNVDPGFQGERVLSARLDPAEAFYSESTARIGFYQGVLERLAALQDVESTAAADVLPMSGSVLSLAHRVRGRDFENGILPMAKRRLVTPGYFKTMRIPLLEGRDFVAQDDPNRRPAVIVNRALAERFWPGDSALGQALGYPWPSDWLEVVGVVEDVLLGELGGGIEPTIYFPYAQDSRASMTVLARTTRDPAALAATLRALVAEADPQVPVSDVRTVRAAVIDSIAQPRLAAAFLSSFALVALALGGFGIYGVIAVLVAQRRQEIGVRLALGAPPARILGQIVVQGMTLASLGICVGLAGAALAYGWIEQFLFDVDLLDLRIVGASAFLLAAVAALASYWPARRASRLDPLESLRAD